MKKTGSNILLLLATLCIIGLVGLAVFLSFYMTDSDVSSLRTLGNEPETIIITEAPRTANAEATTEVSSAQNHSFLFVGDSRTLGLQEALKADSPDDQCRFVAAEGEGFDWFSQDGIQAMDTELKATPDSTVILNLGVNDPGSIDSYITSYQQIMQNYPEATFYVMSVNPVADDCQLISNQVIDEFNKKLKAAFPDQYLDVYNFLLSGGLNTTEDGLHYTDSTYLSIHYYLVNRVASA